MMSKVMSILEKCNLVEKVNNEEPDNSPVAQELDLIQDEVLEPEKNIETENFNNSLKYENKMMIDEIYSLFGLKNSSINTVFMLENLINALPQNLPKDVVKQSVINVMNASDINLNELLSDGQQRREALKTVMNGYNSETNKRIAEYKEEIDRLSGLINNCQEQIKIKESLLEQQEYIIKCESDKVNGIIEYFSN